MKFPLRLALLLLPLCSCAYFNGMYNARRLAGGARKAEREGRAFEANRLWGLAATKAESLQAQHPKSKYVPEAKLIAATSLARSGNCEDAIPMAERTLAMTRNTRIIEDASLMLGTCFETRNDPASALGAYSRLLDSKDQTRRSEAYFRHARAARELGLYQDALADLEHSRNPLTSGERAAALMGLGRKEEALVIIDSLLARHDTLSPWKEILDSYSNSSPVEAEALIDRVTRDTLFRTSVRVDWLASEAERLLPIDRARAAMVLAHGDSLGGGASTHSRQIALGLVLSDLAQVPSLTELPAIIDRLNDLGERGGPSAPQAYRGARAAQSVLTAADPAQRGAPQYDLRLFLAAEVARDSLGAKLLAGNILKQLATEWPDSPYAPKAILAMALFAPAAAESISTPVLEHHADNPYVLAVRGKDAPGLGQLEDSLRNFMLKYRAPGADDRRGRPAVRPGAKPAPREPGVNR